MTAVFSLHLIPRKSSLSISILFLLLLAGPGSPLAPGPRRLRPGPEGRVRAEGKVRPRANDKASTEGDTEIGLWETGDSGVGAAAGQDGGMWEERETTTGFGSVFSIGEGGLWEPRSSSRCVPVPASMALCQNIGYETMRMPNLLGHESPAEAVQQSASWLPLLARECHPDARIFLCSLFAPICLER